MTTPGYPDWERLVRAGGDPIVSINQAITAQANLGPFNVQQWASVIMFCVTGVASDIYQINWLWFADKAMTQLLSSIFQVMADNMQFPLTVPVAGPWLQIQIIPKAGGNVVPVTFTLYGAASQYNSWSVNTYSGGLYRDFSAYAANGTLTFTAANVFYGDAIFSLDATTAVTGNIIIRFLEFSSGLYRAYYQWQTISAGNRILERISMLAAPWQVAITNGATAQSILSALVPASGN
jgi:hypothetical protein